MQAILIIILVFIVGPQIQADPLDNHGNEGHGQANVPSERMNLFGNFNGGGRGKKNRGNFFNNGATTNSNQNLETLTRNLNGFISNMTLPTGQKMSVAFTNLYTLISNFLKGVGKNLQNLLTNGNIIGDLIRNITGNASAAQNQLGSRGLFANFANNNNNNGGNSGGSSQNGPTKVGNTNLFNLLMGSFGKSNNNGNNGGPNNSGAGQSGNSNQRQGGLLGGFTGTKTGGLFNSGG